jgi:hypothetical protein
MSVKELKGNLKSGKTIPEVKEIKQKIIIFVISKW